MKRILPGLVCAVLILLFLPSCKRGEAPDCAALLRSACCRGEDAVLLYSLSGEDAPAAGGDLLSAVFGQSAPPDEWRSLRDAALLLSKRGDGYEALLLRVAHPSEKKRLTILLRRRLSMLQDPEVMRCLGQEYYAYLAGAGVYSFDDCLCLLATGDNDAFLARLREALEKTDRP